MLKVAKVINEKPCFARVRTMRNEKENRVKKGFVVGIFRRFSKWVFVGVLCVEMDGEKERRGEGESCAGVV